MISFWSDSFGNEVEISLYDCSDNLFTLVTVANGFLTDSTINQSLPVFLQRRIAAGEYLKKPYSCNVLSKNAQGEIIRYSVYYVLDSSKQLASLICTATKIPLEDSFEMSPVPSVSDDLPLPQAAVPSPSQSLSLQEQFDSILEDFEMKHKTGLPDLRPEEKRMALSLLFNEGFFNVKGAVAYTASTINISESTIYRYIRERSKNTPATADLTYFA